ncbi:alpha-E domain-containing protein [Methylobrevis pamukkalensis]|uniref:DUF403 domain-containing protein n=1 Tax=Methylobrevis pamukkalensis TaxID=1439726 RepID=A0A1E3H3E6_9HYPH|nr:alpha-E domain-containing protein [Methylobrevis pamukkalensis]ODN70665.1 hypothetical protein A6302_02017 [Methylobrevis pamukkalensis]
MLLSRHADSLFWLARYMERAENAARILETASRLASVPNGDSVDRNEWRAAIVSTGSQEAFDALFDEASPSAVIEFLAFSPQNSSSIRSCFETARNNARSVRTALTIDVWESINSTWLELKRYQGSGMSRQELGTFLNFVKEASLRFDGSAYRTMLRNDAYYFLRLGSYIERADFTARILLARSQLFDPERETISGSLEYYQLSSLLRCVSSLTSYHWVYRESLRPHLIADLMIMREEMPRSLASCYENIARFLDNLARDYGRHGKSQRSARKTLSRLQEADLSALTRSGLDGFLSEFIDENGRLGAAIGEQYLG